MHFIALDGQIGPWIRDTERTSHSEKGGGQTRKPGRRGAPPERNAKGGVAGRSLNARVDHQGIIPFLSEKVAAEPERKPGRLPRATSPEARGGSPRSERERKPAP